MHTLYTTSFQGELQKTVHSCDCCMLVDLQMVMFMSKRPTVTMISKQQISVTTEMLHSFSVILIKYKQLLSSCNFYTDQSYHYQ